MNGKQARLSPETMDALREVGKPFESVDDCLQRVLGCSCVKKEMKNQNEGDEVEDDES